ncbi:DUF4178 domain-containing protein [Herbaspirillum frisingense]|uniref:DUF4178 domain-containing protein n=1 Tax=Herbaspirillum frisingense TaxID=92645 RepID=UPI001F3C07C3|nr:DUF4178 domain-containing protein [Herbaspirillum frisingense]UIN19834.1 DUF4178 domain-containing protein [Herbaspirillum frisingense]
MPPVQGGPGVLRLGAIADFEGQPMAVVGHLQWDTDGALWNQWFLRRGNDRCQWCLSHRNGQYALTREVEHAQRLLPFAHLGRQSEVEMLDGKYVVSDLRSLRCVGGEGEWSQPQYAHRQAKMAELRAGDQVAIVEYSSGRKPSLYRGSRLPTQEVEAWLGQAAVRPTEIVRKRVGSAESANSANSANSAGDSDEQLGTLAFAQCMVVFYLIVLGFFIATDDFVWHFGQAVGFVLTLVMLYVPAYALSEQKALHQGYAMYAIVVIFVALFYNKGDEESYERSHSGGSTWSSRGSGVWGGAGGHK